MGEGGEGCLCSGVTVVGFVWVFVVVHFFHL